MSTEIVVADSVQAQIDKSFGLLLIKHGKAEVGTDGQFLAASAASADNLRYQAEKAVIDSTENLGKGADLIKIINAQQKEIDERRKLRTAPLDSHKKLLIGFFGIPLGILENAKATISDKCAAFRAQEAKRIMAEDKARREAAEAEALARAEAAQQLGGAAAADAVLDGAAAVISDMAPEKVQARGEYGAVFTQTHRWVGEVTDTRAFLGWLSRMSSDEELADILIGFSKRGLNALARKAGETANADPRVRGIQGFSGRKESVDRVA